MKIPGTISEIRDIHLGVALANLFVIKLPVHLPTASLSVGRKP